jgi:sarcosine oxidase subunit delta
MKLMPCPLNGPRNISEFICRGEVTPMPDTECSDKEWSEYVFMENNTAGEVCEWWFHVPTAYWFIVRRNSVTEEIIETCTVADFFSKQVKKAGS